MRSCNSLVLPRRETPIIVFNFSSSNESEPRGGGVLRCCLDGGARLKPPNPYPSLRVIWAERVPIIRGLAEKGTHY